MASKGQERPLIDTHSQRWDQRDKWIVAIAALCASLQSPKRFVDAHVTRDLFDFEVDAQPLDPVQDVSKLPKDVEKLKLEDDPASSSYRARPDRAGELSTEDEAAVQAEVTSMKREGQVEAERESARRRRARTWLEGICERLGIEPHNLPSEPSTQDARELGAQLGKTLWPEVVHDLILFSLSIEDSDETTPGHSHAAQKAAKSEAQKKAQNAFTFSALDRKLVFQTAAILGIPKLDVYMSEKVLAQELFFVLKQLESTHESTSANSMNSTSEGARQEASKKAKWLRYAGAGVGVVAGGAIIGLTGGLAAPLVAPLLAGATGGALAFLTTSGGVIMLGTLFGIGGGGLAGYRVQRRLKGVEEFEFVRVPLRGEEDSDGDSGIPKIPSLHATICVTGFLLKKEDYIDTWRPTFAATADRRDVFALKLETEPMLSAGRSLDHYVRDFLISKGAVEVVKRTALAALYTAVALPATIYKGAALALDNEFQRTRDRAEKGGLLLADVLEKGVQGSRPVILVGSSLGAVTVFRCLLELHSRNLLDLVDHAVLISAPLSPTPSEWAAARHVCSRGLVNAWSDNDWVLAITCRLHSLVSTRLTLKVAGLQDPGIEGIEAVNISDIIGGHLEIGPKMPLILDRVGIFR